MGDRFENIYGKTIIIKREPLACMGYGDKICEVLLPSVSIYPDMLWTGVLQKGYTQSYGQDQRLKILCNHRLSDFKKSVPILFFIRSLSFLFRVLISVTAFSSMSRR